MKINEYVPARKFNLLSKKYTSRTGLPILLVNLKGDIIYSLNFCNLCSQLLNSKNIMLIKNCRLKMISAIRESFRWGEGYITTCPTGLIMFAVPIVFNGRLIGGLLSGFAIFPEMKKDIDQEISKSLKEFTGSGQQINLDHLNLKVFLLEEIREYMSFLFTLTNQYNINDINFLKDINEKYVQQYKIANFLDDLKRSKPDVARKILDKQDEILQKVILGDKSGAREILNEFLGSIFFESGMNFEIIKVRIIELIVIISRAAIETGVEAKELLGLNYSYLTELNKVTDIEELLYKLTEILENFINKVSMTKEKKKKVKMRQIREYINMNFTRRVTAAEVARSVALSVSRVSHLCKEETGLSLTNLITKLRIDYGKYLLLNTDINLADLANKVGFYDQSHFTKNFKRMEKMTPSQFRLKYKS